MELVALIFSQRGAPLRILLASGVDLNLGVLDWNPQEEPLSGKTGLAVQTV
jgi:hypothetical protein